MAAVTGAVAINIVDVAGCAVGVMVPIEPEVFFVFECGRQPGLLCMTLPTVALDFQIQGIADDGRRYQAPEQQQEGGDFFAYQ